MSARIVGVTLTLVVLATACSDDPDPDPETAVTTVTGSSAPGSTVPGSTVPGSTAPGSTATTTTAPTTTAPGTQPTQPTATPAPTPPPVVGDPQVAAEQVATLESPVGLAVRPGDDAAYVVEQDGRVVRLTLAPDTEPETTVVADLTDRTSASGEQGLLGLAFAADGARAWLDYTDGAGDTVVAEYPVAPDGTFDVGAERVLLTIDQPYSNHNGGDLALGPDGMLYIATGDGGSGGDPERRASDPTNLLGKLLRIDPTPSGDAPYSIPPDNPFATEVWSLGLRNPWKIAFDPVTGDLWIADVGQSATEEINAVGATAEHAAGWGANFGWSAFEGNDRYNEDVEDPGDLVFPVWAYPQSEGGCSVSGGAVYRGTAIAGLAPAYVYSDYCSGRVWAFDVASGRNLDLLDGFERVSAVRAGSDGEVYVLEQSGGVHRLVPG